MRKKSLAFLLAPGKSQKPPPPPPPPPTFHLVKDSTTSLAGKPFEGHTPDHHLLSKDTKDATGPITAARPHEQHPLPALIPHNRRAAINTWNYLHTENILVFEKGRHSEMPLVYKPIVSPQKHRREAHRRRGGGRLTMNAE